MVPSRKYAAAVAAATPIWQRSFLPLTADWNVTTAASFGRFTGWQHDLRGLVHPNSLHEEAQSYKIELFLFKISVL